MVILPSTFIVPRLVCLVLGRVVQRRDPGGVVWVNTQHGKGLPTVQSKEAAPQGKGSHSTALPPPMMAGGVVPLRADGVTARCHDPCGRKGGM